MVRLIYVSTATVPMSEAALLEVLEKSREKNKKVSITGILLYGGGNFFQVLEGEKEDVEALYTTISKDDRHHSCMIIDESEIENRTFGSWAMGFRYLKRQDQEHIEGFTDFLSRPIKPEELVLKKDEIVELLYQFKSMLQ